MNLQMQITISQSQKIRQLIYDGKYTEALIRATRLWDAIDCRPTHPEYLWTIMASIVPEVFSDPTNLDSVMFYRPTWVCKYKGRAAFVNARNRKKAAWYAHDDLARGTVIDLDQIEVNRF